MTAIAARPGAEVRDLSMWITLPGVIGKNCREKLGRLFAEPLGFIAEQLEWKDGYAQDTAEAIVEEYRKWIAMHIVTADDAYANLLATEFGPECALGMPSRHVDQAWHRHILFTREYPSFCARVNGAMIHHNPCTRENLESMCSDVTEQVYVRFFGPMPSLWQEREAFLQSGSHASCENDRPPHQAAASCRQASCRSASASCRSAVPGNSPASCR